MGRHFRERIGVAMAEFLRSDRHSKHWIYHARNAAASEQAEATRAKPIAREIEEMRRRPTVRVEQRIVEKVLTGTEKEKRVRPVRCECLFCQSNWDRRDPGLNSCPKC